MNYQSMLVIVLISFIAAIGLLPNSWHSKAKYAIAKCEKNLPRNVRCELIAIPEKKNHD